jgi:hypothetical protein
MTRRSHRLTPEDWDALNPEVAADQRFLHDFDTVVQDMLDGPAASVDGLLLSARELLAGYLHHQPSDTEVKAAVDDASWRIAEPDKYFIHAMSKPARPAESIELGIVAIVIEQAEQTEMAKQTISPEPIDHEAGKLPLFVGVIITFGAFMDVGFADMVQSRPDSDGHDHEQHQ